MPQDLVSDRNFFSLPQAPLPWPCLLSWDHPFFPAMANSMHELGVGGPYLKASKWTTAPRTVVQYPPRAAEGRYLLNGL